jgi:hypothetical protein
MTDREPTETINLDGYGDAQLPWSRPRPPSRRPGMRIPGNEVIAVTLPKARQTKHGTDPFDVVRRQLPDLPHRRSRDRCQAWDVGIRSRFVYPPPAQLNTSNATPNPSQM